MNLRWKIRSCASLATLTLFIVLSLASREVQAAAWLGQAFGASVPNADNTTLRGAWAISAGAVLSDEYGIGAYYLASHQQETMNGTKAPFDFDLIGLQFGYHFDGEAKGAWFGGRLGITKLTVGNSGSAVSTSPFHVGVAGGYDHMMGDHFSLGGEASAISVGSSSGTPEGSQSSRSLNGFVHLGLLAVAKVWF